jgi:hypothetical protein
MKTGRGMVRWGCGAALAVALAGPAEAGRITLAERGGGGGMSSDHSGMASWHGGGGDRHGGGSRSSGTAVSYRGDGFSISFSSGSRSRHPHYGSWRGRSICRPMPPPCPPRCPPRPIIRPLGCDLRLYQPAVYGHPALVQRWCPMRREWITLRTHPSLY